MLKHPVQKLASNHKGDLLYTLVKDTFQVYQISSNTINKIFEYKDTYKVESTHNEVSSEEPPVKKNKKSKKASNYQPNKHQLENYEFLRYLNVSPCGEYIFVISDFDKSVLIFNQVSSDDTYTYSLVKKQSFPKRPNCLVSTDKLLFVGDKFGDVYEIDYKTSETINVEGMKPILGHVGLLTKLEILEYENKKLLMSCDRDEHIKLSHIPQSFIINKYLYGHKEFISTVVKIGDYVLSSGGDSFIMLSNWKTGELVTKFEYLSLIEETDIIPEIHNALDRFQKKGEEKVNEFCISDMIYDDVENRVYFAIEGVKKVFVLNFIESERKLALEKTIKVDNIILNFAFLNIDNKRKLIFNTNRESNKSIVDVLDNDNLQLDSKSTELINLEISKSTDGDHFNVVDKDNDMCPININHNLRKHVDFY
ncbi:hypothetical protein ACO0R3_002833 [Hanseniaspora guilliermondii]